MEWKIEFLVKDYIRDWSDQNIVIKYKSTNINITIKDMMCKMQLCGSDVEEAFYLTWELLFLYDGYFYKPQKYYENSEEKNPSKLIRLPFYDTDETWYSSELLGRNQRDLSEQVIEQYARFRNEGMINHKMTKSVVNAFYYLHSRAYGEINPNHRLSLLLNICDGLVNNTFKETKNVKGNFEYLFKNCIDKEKIKHGMSLLGMPYEQFTYNLAQERHAFDHYIYKADSLSAFVSASTSKKEKNVIWYFIYIIDLVLRINFLKLAGFETEEDVRDYAMDVILDRVIFENDIPEKCSTSGYQMRQIERQIERQIKA